MCFGARCSGRAPLCGNPQPAHQTVTADGTATDRNPGAQHGPSESHWTWPATFTVHHRHSLCSQITVCYDDEADGADVRRGRACDAPGPGHGGQRGRQRQRQRLVREQPQRGGSGPRIIESRDLQAFDPPCSEPIVAFSLLTRTVLARSPTPPTLGHA